jgi:hypothetical protein
MRTPDEDIKSLGKDDDASGGGNHFAPSISAMEHLVEFRTS